MLMFSGSFFDQSLVRIRIIFLQCVLSASPVFRRIFLSDSQRHQSSVTILLTDFATESIASLLKFLYTGQVGERQSANWDDAIGTTGAFGSRYSQRRFYK